MSYLVPGMKLLPQTLTMSCWYASAQMLIHWKQEQAQASFMGLIPPELDVECIKLRDSNSGIANRQILKMAQRLGLEFVPPLSPTPGAIEDWLRVYGPLWVNGKTHIVVIAGIERAYANPSPYYDSYRVLVYDPAPVNVGRIEWRSLDGWYIGGSVSSRDTSREVQAVFLHCPLI